MPPFNPGGKATGKGLVETFFGSSSGKGGGLVFVGYIAPGDLDELRRILTGSTDFQSDVDAVAEKVALKRAKEKKTA